MKTKHSTDTIDWLFIGFYRFWVDVATKVLTIKDVSF